MKTEAKVHHSYTKSVHGIGKSMIVVARFFDAAYGGDLVVVRDHKDRHQVLNEDDFLAEYPIRLKAPWDV